MPILGQNLHSCKLASVNLCSSSIRRCTGLQSRWNQCKVTTCNRCNLHYNSFQILRWMQEIWDAQYVGNRYIYNRTIMVQKTEYMYLFIF